MDSKAWYMSKTVWGGLVAMAALIAGIFGHPITADTQNIIVDNMETIVTGVVGIAGAAMAIYGRVKASTTITKT